MKRIPLEFKFKGNRNYVHGPDMYTIIFEKISSTFPKYKLKSIKLFMHQFASKQCVLNFGTYDEKIDKPKNAVAEVIAVTDNGKIHGWLEETDHLIESKYEFDESRIERLCKMERNKISIEGECGYSPVEVVTSMTKQLHYSLFPSDDKWVITRIDLKRSFIESDSANLVIENKHNLDNRLTKSEIFSSGELIGYIYFSLVKR